MRFARLQRRHRPTSPRGVAMLLVIVAIAILTAVAAEFSYNSRVDLQLAANYRDDIRAYYLAKSAVGMSRLLLSFQKQLDSIQIPDLGALMGGQAPGGAGSGGSGLSIKLWELARVDCHMLQGLVPQSEGMDEGERRSDKSSGKFKFDEEFPELAQSQTQRSFGGFEGCFQAKIEPEEPKLNLNRLESGVTSEGPMAARLVEMFSDKRFEFLFAEEDANKVKTSPQELVVAFRDWIDPDENQSQINTSGRGEVFVQGGAGESSLYDRYRPRYQPKNQPFDTLDELHMVHGVNDAFMAAFRDRLTVYSDKNSPPNINTDDPLLLYMAVLAVADPPNQTALQNPVFVDQLIKKIREQRMFSFIGMSAETFLRTVETAGVTVNSSIRSNMRNNRLISDKSNTFTIKALGEAGSVQKSITAVVRMDGQGLGRLLYWREE